MYLRLYKALYNEPDPLYNGSGSNIHTCYAGHAATLIFCLFYHYLNTKIFMVDSFNMLKKYTTKIICLK